MLYFEMYTWKSNNLWHNKLTGQVTLGRKALNTKKEHSQTRT